MIPFLVVTAVASSVCGGSGRPTGPVTVGLLPGRLGAMVDPCLRTEVGLAAGGSLLVDRPDFYGRLQTYGALDLRVRVHERVEISGRSEFWRSDLVLAPVAVSASGLGATRVGVTAILEQTEEQVFAVSSGVVLPTAPYVNAAPLGLDLALIGARTTRGGDLHGGLTVYGQTMLGRGPAAEKAALAGRLGITRHITSNGLALVVDLPVSMGWTRGFDHLALAGALRWGTGAGKARGLYGELGVFAPLLGRERTSAALELRTGYRFR